MIIHFAFSLQIKKIFQALISTIFKKNKKKYVHVSYHLPILAAKQNNMLWLIMNLNEWYNSDEHIRITEWKQAANKADSETLSQSSEAPWWWTGQGLDKEREREKIHMEKDEGRKGFCKR